MSKIGYLLLKLDTCVQYETLKSKTRLKGQNLDTGFLNWIVASKIEH